MVWSLAFCFLSTSMFDAVSLYWPVIMDSNNWPKLMKDPLSVMSIGIFSIVTSAPVSGMRMVFFSTVALEGSNFWILRPWLMIIEYRKSVTFS